MYVLKTIVGWGWSPILITALAVAGFTYEWPVGAVATGMVLILVIGLVVAVTGAREKELEHSSLRFRQLAGYFSRRFTSTSSLSIFAVINSLSNIDNPQVSGWVRACDMSQRIFDTWCSSFVGRVESDVRTGRFDVYLLTYLNELWLINDHYHEFIDHFYEVAEKIGISGETVDQYNVFVVEYNTFIQDFRDHISTLRKIAKTQIEPPSAKLARELPVVK